MPIHDWTRVSAGTLHGFHLSWIAALQSALNDGRMPAEYYAQAEQVMGPNGPDVLALQRAEPADDEPEGSGGLAVALAPPKPKVLARLGEDFYVHKRRTLTIRHVSGDRPVALVELVSPGNKESRHALRQFLDKAQETLARGIHLLVVDLFPPGKRDPQGLHAALWERFEDDPPGLPAGLPLALLAYDAGPPLTVYQEATAVGRELLDMPLFLEPGHYIDVPLEETYREAWRGLPRKWREALEAP